MANLSFFLSSLLVLAALHGTHAVDYIVMNRAETTTGGARFNNELGVDYTKETMASATNFIWNLFQQSNEADRKSVQSVSLFVDDMDGIIESPPGGLIEGVADFVRLKADYVPSGWVQPGGGNRWDEGYSVTARFLDYCNGLKDGFVAELNKKMRDGYIDNYFVELLGKTVDQLWTDYPGSESQ
ncbi:hypothetical protein FH972_004597 [Carpinus fangiana]|uniref:Uncharacterized protein n=1 Tax=Carpinus fangiana TaxID=176857 RepID=A0A5N6QPY9_9ROSI|nr:hypothetical protein FH972_004597 [Carpinus fangiana]